MKKYPVVSTPHRQAWRRLLSQGPFLSNSGGESKFFDSTPQHVVKKIEPGGMAKRRCSPVTKPR